MTLLQRLSMFLGFCLLLATFWLVPDELGFDANARLIWAGGRAARRTAGRGDRLLDRGGAHA